MKKNTNYFPHDFHARTDSHILKLLMDLKWEGYGLYWAICEKLHESGGWLPDDLDCLAFEMRTDSERIARLLREFSLFRFEDGKFTSDRVLKNLKEREEKSDKARSSSMKRWDSNANVMRTHNERNPNAMLRKERKGKERKEKKDLKTKDTGTKNVPAPTSPPRSISVSSPPSFLTVVQQEIFNTPQAAFVDKFKKSYEGMTGEPFKADKKHYVIATALISKYGEEEVTKKAICLGALCKDRSVWFTKGGWADYSLEKLSSQWNAIIPSTVETEEQKALKAAQKVREENERANNFLAGAAKAAC